MPGKDEKMDLNDAYANGQYSEERRSRGRIITDGQRRQLQELATELALVHKFEDVDALDEFLVQVWFLMDVGSAVAVAGGKVVSPNDQQEFKPTREQLARLRDHLSEVASIIGEVPYNETLGAALHHSDQSGDMNQQFEALLELLETSRRAANLEGSAGRRPNDDWVQEFCVACQKLWLQSGKTGTAIVFHTEFPTPITRWVEAVYVGLRRLKGERDDLTKLRTAAKSVSAYRGQKQTD